VPKRSVRLGAGVVAGLTVLALTVSAMIPSSSAQTASEETFTVIAALNRDAYSASGSKPATTQVIAWKVRNEAQTARVGRELDVCVYEFGLRQYCESAFHFTGRGTIIVEGPWDAGKELNRLAVTGGTGDFEHVAGIARFSRAPSGGTPKVRVEFVLLH
jgi:hypothetical protein